METEALSILLGVDDSLKQNHPTSDSEARECPSAHIEQPGPLSFVLAASYDWAGAVFVVHQNVSHKDVA